jgi:hypothetical protein
MPEEGSVKEILQRYGKALVAVVVAALTLASSALVDGHLDAGEGVQIAIAATTAIAVWLVPNLPNAGGVKTGIAVVLAVLNALTAYIVDGIDTDDVINLVLAGLGVLLIGAAPAQSAGDNLVPRPVAASMNRDRYGTT